MTIEENMAFAYSRGQTRTFSPMLCRSTLDHFREKLSLLGMGLENRLNEAVKILSGGQRQALSLVMALLRPSKLLLLDEITAALNPDSGKRLMELVAKLIEKEQRTTLMITHNTNHIKTYGDRIVNLENGKLVPCPR